MQVPDSLPRLVELIAENTYRLRKERGWSQEKLARQMEIQQGIPKVMRSFECLNCKGRW